MQFKSKRGLVDIPNADVIRGASDLLGMDVERAVKELRECRRYNKAPTVPTCQFCGKILDDTDDSYHCPQCNKGGSAVLAG